jgi:hypothetical protein
MAISDSSWAHGGGHRRHSSIGVYIGGPIGPWYSPYRPPPYYYYPPVVAVPVTPPPPTVYIERATEAPPAQSYWYYCSSSQAYYPYVQQCSEGWQKVMPTPP